MVYIVFAFGLLVGSFLNVCIYRIPKGESIITPPSHCPECGARIKWFDLVPVVSWLILGGRCRACGGRISPRYPLVELTNAVLWAAVFLKYGMSAPALIYMLLCSALIVTAFIDMEHMIIPDGINIFILLLSLAFCIIKLDIHILISSAIGFLSVSGPLFIIAVLSRGGIGGGDIKLSAAAGALLGWRLSLAAWAFAVIISGVYAVILLMLGKKKKGDAVPLGPFLALGFVLSVFFGMGAIDWYMGFFL